jgi:hypothetical protein
MAWNSTQASGTVIDFGEWNEMVSYINSTHYSSAVGWNSVNFNNSSLTWDNSLKQWKALKSGGGAGDLTLETANGLYAGSANINRTLLDTISGALDTKIDAVTAGSISGPMGGSVGGHDTYGISSLVFISSQNISGGSIIGNIQYPFDYIIYRDDKWYHLKDGKTGKILYSHSGAYYSGATSTFNYAIDRASSEDKRIFIYPGSYITSGQIDLLNHTHLHGAGKDLTSIKLMSGSNAEKGGFYGLNTQNIHLSDFMVSGFYNIALEYNTSDTYKNFEFRNLCFNYEYSSQMNTDGPYCHPKRYLGDIRCPGLCFTTGDATIDDVTIDNCDFIKCHSHGFVFYGNGEDDSEIRNVKINNCKAIRCGIETSNWGAGMVLTHGPRINGMSVTNCFVSGCWEGGIYMEGGRDVQGCHVDNCVSMYNGVVKAQQRDWDYNNLFSGSQQGHGFGGQGDITWTNCLAKGNRYRGWWIGNVTREYGDPYRAWKILNCTIDGDGITCKAGIDGSAPTGSIIEGNIIRNLITDGPNGTSGYGMNLEKCRKVIIRGNQIFMNSGTAIARTYVDYPGGDNIITDNIISYPPISTVGNSYYISAFGIDGLTHYRDTIRGNKIYCASTAIRTGYDVLCTENYIHSGIRAIDVGQSFSTISNNIIKSIELRGIICEDDSVKVSDNYISRTPYAIWIGLCKESIFSNNYISGATVGINSYYADDERYKGRNSIRGNYITNTSSHGLQARFFDLAVDNTILKAGSNGLYLRGDGGLAANNYISGCVNDGIDLASDSSDWRVENNIIAGASAELVDDNGTNNQFFKTTGKADILIPVYLSSPTPVVGNILMSTNSVGDCGGLFICTGAAGGWKKVTAV